MGEGTLCRIIKVMNMSNITAGLLAVPVAGSIWLAVMAEPLKISRTTFDKHHYAAGEPLIATSTGEKSAWAKRFCHAVKSSLYLRDSIGMLVEFEQPMNYNDGSIRTVRSHRKVPGYFSPGEASGWESVTYRCFAIRNFTAHSSVRGRFYVNPE